MSINYGRIEICQFHKNKVHLKRLEIPFSKKNRGSHVAIPVVEHIEPGSSKDSIIGFCRANNYQTVSRFESVPSAARSNSVPVFLG